jgi:alkylation response protein AidB-like acyl-CoA dehydrogenase
MRWGCEAPVHTTFCELVRGRAFYRALSLERLYRDVQGARFHPLPEKPQQLVSGRLALGLELEAA